MFVAEQFVVMRNKEWMAFVALGLWKRLRDDAMFNTIEMYQLPLEDKETTEVMYYFPKNLFCKGVFQTILNGEWELTIRERMCVYQLAVGYVKTVGFGPLTKRVPILAFAGLIRTSVNSVEWKKWQGDIKQAIKNKYLYVTYREGENNIIMDYKWEKK